MQHLIDLRKEVTEKQMLYLEEQKRISRLCYDDRAVLQPHLTKLKDDYVSVLKRQSKLLREKVAARRTYLRYL